MNEEIRPPAPTQKMRLIHEHSITYDDDDDQLKRTIEESLKSKQFEELEIKRIEFLENEYGLLFSRLSLFGQKELNGQILLDLYRQCLNKRVYGHYVLPNISHQRQKSLMKYIDSLGNRFQKLRDFLEKEITVGRFK